MTVSRVIVGTDRSPGADAARRWGSRLAARLDARIAVRTIDELVTGSIAERLMFEADRSDDLLVVGRRGRGGFPALQLGSAAHQLAEHAGVPVAVVPAAAPDGAVSILVVGVDGSPAAGGALRWASSLAARLGAVVVAVHAVDIGPAVTTAGLTDVVYADAVDAVSTRFREKWTAPLRDAGVTHETVCLEGGPATVILDTAASFDADLIVVGRQGASAAEAPTIGSVAHRVVAFAPCPVVVVPPTVRR